MFYLGGVGIAFFLTLLLFSKRKKTTADKILTGWLLLMSVHLLLFYFYKMWYYPQLLGLAIPFPLAHGPFLYVYTLALTKPTISLKTQGLHFIPFISIFIYLVPFFMLPVEQKIFVFKNHGMGYETFNLIMSYFIIISGVSYIILSSVVLRKHRISIANEFSFTEKINLVWLQYLIYGISLIWILVIIGNDDWVYGAAVFFILFIGYFGIRQVGIFHSPEIIAPPDKAETNYSNPGKAESNPNTYEDQGLPSDEKRKYQKSGLSAEGAEALHRQLTQVMRDEKHYLESELSLYELAGRLDTQPNYLSQVINEREGKNFYDYINTLRIEEFKRVAVSSESRKYTLMALAQQCGFNSKSSFNRCFKKVTGQSPSEYIGAVSDSHK